MSVNKYNSQTGQLENLASGQRTWVGTQAAYKAAKQAGTLPNNAIIAITDDEVDHNHYSTEETVTGMYWIDGKPIYRKVFELTTRMVVGSTFPINNLDKIINYGGYGYYSTNRYLRPLPWEAHSTAINEWTSTGAKYWAEDDMSLESGSVIWIEYTKTTEI